MTQRGDGGSTSGSRHAEIELNSNSNLQQAGGGGQQAALPTAISIDQQDEIVAEGTDAQWHDAQDIEHGAGDQAPADGQNHDVLNAGADAGEREENERLIFQRRARILQPARAVEAEVHNQVQNPQAIIEIFRHVLNTAREKNPHLFNTILDMLSEEQRAVLRAGRNDGPSTTRPLLKVADKPRPFSILTRIWTIFIVVLGLFLAALGGASVFNKHWVNFIFIFVGGILGSSPFWKQIAALLKI